MMLTRDEFVDQTFIARRTALLGIKDEVLDAIDDHDAEQRKELKAKDKRNETNGRRTVAEIKKADDARDMYAASELRCDRMRKERDDATERLADYLDDARRVLADECAKDEVHCACVPHLRRRIKELEKQLSECIRQEYDDLCRANREALKEPAK